MADETAGSRVRRRWRDAGPFAAGPIGAMAVRVTPVPVDATVEGDAPAAGEGPEPVNPPTGTGQPG